MDCSMPAPLSFTVSQSLLKFMSIESVILSNHLILCLFLLLPDAQHQGLSQWIDSLHQVAKVLKPQLQHQSFKWIFRVDFLKDWLVALCCSRDCQESSPAPQFKGISSLALSLLYDPVFTLVHDYWKDLGFNYTDLCWQSDVSAF